MGKEIVDIIIPFHRVNHDLKQAVKSAHETTGVQTRIVAVNDSGLEVLKEELDLKPEDLLIKSKFPGYIGALSAGVQAVTSPYVAFLDSDDLIDPSKISTQLEEMLLNDLDVVTCEIVKFSQSDLEYLDFHILGKLPDCLKQSEKLIFGAYGADSSILIRREILKSTWASHSMYPSHLADYGWLLANVYRFRVGHISQPLYFYRSHGLQMSRNSNLSVDWRQLHSLWLRNLVLQFPSFSEISSEISSEMSRYIAFPFSRPKLSIGERIKTLRILYKLRGELVRSHSSEPKNQFNFINLRIAFLECGLNPIHILYNGRLLINVIYYIFRARDIKRR